MNVRAAAAGPAFLARTGLRASGRDLLVNGAIVALTAFLVTLVPLWFGQTASEVLQARLAAATEAQRGLEFELRGRLDPGAGDPLAAVTMKGESLTAELPPTIRGAVASPDTLVDSLEFLAVGAPRPILRVGLRIQDTGNAVRWVEGRAPGGGASLLELPDRPAADGGSAWANLYEVAFSTGTAAETDLHVGDRVLLVPGTNVPGFVALDVVGLFEMVDPAAGRWFADPTLATAIEERVSQEVTIYHAVALVDPGIYPALYGTEETPASLTLPFRYRWRYRLDATRVEAAGTDALAAELARLRAGHPFAGAPGTPGLSTGLADLVEHYAADRASAATAIALAMMGPLAAMLATLALVAAAVATRRRAAIQVVRARGGAVSQVVAGRALEAVVVAVPAALLGGVLAGLVVPGGWDAGALAPAVAVGLVGGALAAGAAVGAARRPPAARETGPGGHTARHRLVPDLLVVAIALGGAASLRGRDLAGAGGVNLLEAAIPVLLALAGGVIVLRLYPAAVSVVARASASRSDLVVVHGLRGVERGAAGQQIALLAVMLAVAIGVFSALVVGTLAHAEERAAAEAIGADFMVQDRAGGRLPETLDVGAVAGVQGTAAGARSEGSLIGAGRVPARVDVVALDVPAWLDVVAGRALDADLPAALGAFPPANAGAPESPLPALVGATTMARLGLAPGQDGRLTLLGSTISIRAVEARASFPGLGSADQLVVVDLAAARIALPAAELATGLVFVRAPSSAAAALQRETDRYAPTVVMASREATLAEIRRAPLLEAVRGGFGAAVSLALIYVVAVVGVATRRATLARRRELAVLETLGLARRGVLRLLAVEVAPLVVTGLAAGVVVGLVIGALVVPELVPGTLGGLDGPTEIVADPLVLVSIGIAPVAAAAAALVLGARGMRGAELAQATREVDA